MTMTVVGGGWCVGGGKTAAKNGADTFMFDANSLKGHNTATITDYNPKVDKLQILSDAHVEMSSDHHGGTLLQIGNDTIDLLGVKPNELHNRDFA